MTPPGDGSGAWSLLSAGERQRRNHERAAGRAVSSSRRYLVANRLRYMWVLTFAEGLHGPEGRAACMDGVAAFVERLAAVFGPQPYWYSPELHPGGHGWHVNFFVGRRLRHDQVREVWGRGHVWVKDWTADSRIKALGLPLLAAIRLGAVYGCKYAAKDWAEEVLAGGAHRYEVGQGFQPVEHTERFSTLAEALERLEEFFDHRPPVQRWASSESPGWAGPPVYRWMWDQAPGGAVRGG